MFKHLSLKSIGFYQKYIRPVLPESCRFYPSCSEYAKQAVAKYGFWQGGAKAAIRLLRCQPFSRKSGYDPLL
jgi:putative membrane protein insertion efficiency factor